MNLTETILRSTTKLPPFPMVIQRAIQLINDPNSSAQQVVDVIQFDQAITANVLIAAESVGGSLNRTLTLELASGKVWVKTSGNGVEEI